MTRVLDIYNYIDEFAPFNKAEAWDNPGLLVGSAKTPVTKALISLDITTQVVNEAGKIGAELIVSHHPVIFKPLLHLDVREPAYLLARQSVAAICAHTNLDIAVGGVNDVLARAVGLKGELSWLSENGEQAVGRVGNLEKALPLAEYILFVEKTLGSNTVRYCEGGKDVKRVALVGGAGGDMVATAALLGVDTLLTGDVKYHEFLQAKEYGINLIDAGHFATENLIIEPLKKRLEARFADVKFVVSEHKDIVKRSL